MITMETAKEALYSGAWQDFIRKFYQFQENLSEGVVLYCIEDAMLEHAESLSEDHLIEEASNVAEGFDAEEVALIKRVVSNYPDLIREDTSPFIQYGLYFFITIALRYLYEGKEVIDQW